MPASWARVPPGLVGGDYSGMAHTFHDSWIGARASTALLALLGGCATASTLPAPSPVREARTHVPTPTEGAITAADAMTRLYIFADDSMLGREATTLGNVKGTDYVAAEMRRMGLEPAGDNGTFFQTVPTVISRVDSTKTISPPTGVQTSPVATPFAAVRLAISPK